MRKKQYLRSKLSEQTNTFESRRKKMRTNRNGFFLKIVLLFWGCFIFFKMSLMNFGYSANQRRTSHI